MLLEYILTRSQNKTLMLDKKNYAEGSTGTYSSKKRRDHKCLREVIPDYEF